MDPRVEELCLSCGLCCQGVFFSKVQLTSDEAAILDGLQLPIIEKDDLKIMMQPCAAHSGGKCTVYSSRPSPCRSYECGLLQDVNAGRTNFEDAKNIIGQTVGLVNALYSWMGYRNPAEVLWDQLKSFAAENGETDDEEKFRRLHAPFFLNAAVLRRLCEKHFRPPWKNVNGDIHVTAS